MLVIESHNQNTSSCKLFGVPISPGHSSGLINIFLSHWLASLFVHKLIHHFYKNSFCFFVFPNGQKLLLIEFNSFFIFLHCYFFRKEKFLLLPPLSSADNSEEAFIVGSCYSCKLTYALKSILKRRQQKPYQQITDFNVLHHTMI